MALAGPWLTPEAIADALYAADVIDTTQRAAFVAAAYRPFLEAQNIREVQFTPGETTYYRLHEDGSVMYETDSFGHQIGPDRPPSGTPDQIERAADTFEKQQGYRPAWAPKRPWWRRITH